MAKHQTLVYIDGELKIGHPSPMVAVEKKPTRVWSLYMHTDPNVPPSLPFHPQHMQNAFLEDYVHDWSWHNGKLRYGSRVTNGHVWLLLEYED